MKRREFLKIITATVLLQTACRSKGTDANQSSQTHQPTANNAELTPNALEAPELEALQVLTDNKILSSTWEPFHRETDQVTYPHTLATVRLTDLSQLVDTTTRVPNESHIVSEIFKNNLLQLIDNIADNVIKHLSDETINPQFATLLFLKSEKLYYKEVVQLLDILNQFKHDVLTGSVILALASDDLIPNNATMAMKNEILYEESIPGVGKSIIYINPQAIYEKYSASEDSDQTVGLGMLSLVLLLIYEYSNRLITQSKIEYLQQNYLPNHPVTTQAELDAVLTQFDKLLFNRGERQSRDQNIIQLALFLSLKHLAGGKDVDYLTGAERHENWSVFLAYLLSKMGGPITNSLPLIRELTSFAEY